MIEKLLEQPISFGNTTLTNDDILCANHFDNSLHIPCTTVGFDHNRSFQHTKK